MDSLIDTWYNVIDTIYNRDVHFKLGFVIATINIISDHVVMCSKKTTATTTTTIYY